MLNPQLAQHIDGFDRFGGDDPHALLDGKNADELGRGSRPKKAPRFWAVSLIDRVLRAFLTRTLGLAWTRLQCRNKVLADQCEEHIKQISALLGSVGAPLVHLDHGSNISKYELELISEFVHAHVDLFLQLHQTMNVLRRGTSLLFGVGSNNACIERVEKSAMGRWLRQAEQQRDRKENRSSPILGRMPISMPALRRRVDDILNQEIRLLTEISGESPVCDHRQEAKVLTLSMLSAKKSRALDLLSFAVGRAWSFDKETQIIVKESMREAKNSTSYLLSASENTTTTDRGMFPKESNSFNITRMLEQTESLRVGLLAFYDASLYQQSSSAEEIIWWEKIEKLVKTLELTVREVSLRIRTSTDSEKCLERDFKEETEKHAVSREEEEVHSSTWLKECSSHLGPTNDDSQEFRKTVVFSGVAAQRPRKTTKRTVESASTVNGVSMPLQFQLVDELNERIRSLPPPDEVDAKDKELPEAIVARREDAANSNFTETPPVRMPEIEKITVPIGDFLGELKNSLHATGTRAQGECLLGDTEDDCSI